MRNSIENANSPIHYIILTVFIFFGLFGVFFRFAGETPIYSWISNIALIIAAFFAIRQVFKIMK